MNASTTSPRRALLASALSSIVPALALVAGAAFAIARTFQLPAVYTAQSLAAFAGLLLALSPFLPQHLPLKRFGAANCVTLLRAGIAGLMAGLIGSPMSQPDLAWLVAILAMIAPIARVSLTDMTFTGSCAMALIACCTNGSEISA